MENDSSKISTLISTADQTAPSLPSAEPINGKGKKRGPDGEIKARHKKGRTVKREETWTPERLDKKFQEFKKKDFLLPKPADIVSTELREYVVARIAKETRPRAFPPPILYGGQADTWRSVAESTWDRAWLTHRLEFKAALADPASSPEIRALNDAFHAFVHANPYSKAKTAKLSMCLHDVAVRYQLFWASIPTRQELARLGTSKKRFVVDYARWFERSKVAYDVTDHVKMFMYGWQAPSIPPAIFPYILRRIPFVVNRESGLGVYGPNEAALRAQENNIVGQRYRAANPGMEQPITSERIDRTGTDAVPNVVVLGAAQHNNDMVTALEGLRNPQRPNDTILIDMIWRGPDGFVANGQGWDTWVSRFEQAPFNYRFRVMVYQAQCSPEILQKPFFTNDMAWSNQMAGFFSVAPIPSPKAAQRANHNSAAYRLFETSWNIAQDKINDEQINENRNSI